MSISPIFVLLALTLQEPLQVNNFHHVVLDCAVTYTTHFNCGGGLMTPEERAKLDCSHWVPPKEETVRKFQINFYKSSANFCDAATHRCGSGSDFYLKIEKSKLTILFLTSAVVGNSSGFSYEEMPQLLTDAAGSVSNNGSCSVSIGKKYIDRLIGNYQ